MSYMYMHCFFKFLAHVNSRINSLTFKTENTKTLTYNFSSLIVWKSDSNIKEKLIARREFDNQFGKFAVKVLNGEETVSHLPHKYSRIAWYFEFSLVVDQFLSKWAAIVDIVNNFVVEGDSLRSEVHLLKKAMLNWLKALLMKKV